jgi:ferredoxin-NADP reductase
MSIEWTDEAVSDALRKYLDSCGSMPLEDAMRAALDAAVKAEGFEVMLWKKRKDVRAEAFEEAAKVCDGFNVFSYVSVNRENGEWTPGSPYDRGAKNAADVLAAAIRDLAKEGK